AIALDDGASTTLDQLEQALRMPARPLFLGRKPCLPAAPLLLGKRSATGVRAALEAEPLAAIGPRKAPERVLAIWPDDEATGVETDSRYDQRDWSNNIHRGTARYAVGFLEVAA